MCVSVSVRHFNESADCKEELVLHQPKGLQLQKGVCAETHWFMNLLC